MLSVTPASLYVTHKKIILSYNKKEMLQILLKYLTPIATYKSMVSKVKMGGSQLVQKYCQKYWYQIITVQNLPYKCPENQNLALGG